MGKAQWTFNFFFKVSNERIYFSFYTDRFSKKIYLAAEGDINCVPKYARVFQRLEMRDGAISL